MSRKDIIPWVLSVTLSLRLSQSKTLADLVAATVRLDRVNLALIGRRMAGTVAAKHTIKRAWRFTANDRIEIADGMAGLIQGLVRKRKKRLLVSLDWTEVRDFHTLMAAAAIHGRAVPLLWASYPEWQLFRSQNALEEGLLRLLRTLIPKSVPVVILADRGFGRAEFAAVCQELGFRYLVRIKPDVRVACRRYRGRLDDYPVWRGISHVLRQVAYRADGCVIHHVVIRWQEGLPKERDEPWFLMTDLAGSAAKLCRLFARRMTVEELFRDAKNLRNGWAVRNTRIEHVDHFDRFLLILAVSYWLLVGLGLKARAEWPSCWWCTNTRDAECSDFTIGRAGVDLWEYPPQILIRAVRKATEEVGANWG
jgi:hypothetical protein